MDEKSQSYMDQYFKFIFKKKYNRGLLNYLQNTKIITAIFFISALGCVYSIIGLGIDIIRFIGESLGVSTINSIPGVTNLFILYAFGGIFVAFVVSITFDGFDKLSLNKQIFIVLYLINRNYDSLNNEKRRKTLVHLIKQLVWKFTLLYSESKSHNVFYDTEEDKIILRFKEIIEIHLLPRVANDVQSNSNKIILYNLMYVIFSYLPYKNRFCKDANDIKSMKDDADKIYASIMECFEELEVQEPIKLEEIPLKDKILGRIKNCSNILVKCVNSKFGMATVLLLSFALIIYFTIISLKNSFKVDIGISLLTFLAAIISVAFGLILGKIFKS